MAKQTKGTGSPAMASEQRDYIAIAIEYAEAAVADTDRKRFGKWVRWRQSAFWMI
ncbi:hypothetical protein [Massilia violaceinigra]|uniref:hypothetical protein n=1 Tax=Massilia violaceinigra TaxID=2045208 RepID=UPI001E51E5C8|nr:hypothetical protein [Massilia violaceinigra]